MTAGAPRLPPSRVRRRIPDGCPLSPGEYAIIVASAQGESGKQIAVRTNRSESTVRTLRSHAYARLGVFSISEAVVAFYDAGWMLPGKLKVTAREQVYLHAFDLHLRSRTVEEQRVTRQIMDRARDAAGIPAASKVRRRQIDGLLKALHATDGNRRA